MGNVPTIASNDADNVVNAITNLVIQGAQDCSFSYNETADINIVNTGSGDIDVGDIDISQVVLVDTQCIQTDQTCTNIKKNVQQKVGQVARSLSSGLSLNTTESENIAVSVANLSDHIAEQFTNQCASAAGENSTITLKNTASGNIYAGDINVDQYVSGVQKCILKTASKTTAYTQVRQTIQQKSTATSLGMGFGLLIIAAIVIFVIIFVFNSRSFVVILIVLAIFAAAYLVLAAHEGWWPFTRSLF